jgi:condensin complex subunit 3
MKHSCPTTYAKTVELLCTNWLKTMKYDPILLLDNLNPVLNEHVCEEVTRVLLRVASTIDCDASPSFNHAAAAAVDRGVDLVRKQFGGPEVRTLIQIVLKRRNIITTTASNGCVEDKNNNEEESNQDENSKKDLGLSPSMALFLRVKCEYMSDAISDIITDIPTLCNLLNSTIDKLIQFNNNDDYEDMDEDEAAAHEDDQNFVCLQLIHMARASELREEGSRRYFISIMRRILSRLATPDDLVEACVKAMASAHDKESQFLQTISEILVDVEDDDSFHSKVQDQRAIVIVRQMRIIAILSIVLESISGHMTSHPILDGFFQHLSPAITSKNAIVREHGVICLSKFCLLSGEDKVMEEFKPLLMMIAGSVAERVEVRAQAALALCDLALIHEKMLLGTSSSSNNDEEDDGANAFRPNAIPFKDMLFEMLGHSKPGIVIIGAEITAKLLLAGRLSDPELVAWLLVIYFDSTLTTSEDDRNLDVVGGADEVAKRVGSPVRLQQLLSIFFPAYSMSSLDANDDMMASVCPLLSIVNEKLSGMKLAEAKDAIVQRFPIAKMIEYVCYNVDLADKKKAGAAVAKSTGEKAGDEEISTLGEQETISQRSEGGSSEDVLETYKAELEEKGVVAIEASSILLASIEIAQFLAEESDSAPVLYIRALAKILGSACIDVDAEDTTLIRQLKSLVSEAEYANDDGPTVKSIKKLAELLVDINVDDNDEGESSDDESNVSKDEVEEVAMQDFARESIDVTSGKESEDVAIEDTAGEAIEAVSEMESEGGAIDKVAGEAIKAIREKENSRLSIESIQSKIETKGEERRASSERTRLSNVICN